MALARVKVWTAETLYSADLNAEFNNILNNVSSLICPITFNLTFTDATYDIGASGASRPRDMFLSRNITVGGTAAITGVATLTAQPILSSLTASRAVFTDASKGLVSNAISGTGNVAMTTNAVFTTPDLGTPSALVGTNITGTATAFTATSCTTIPSLSGDVTNVGNVVSLTSPNALMFDLIGIGE